MPSQPYKLVVWINAEAKRYFSQAGLGLALVRGQCEGRQNKAVCDVIAVTDVLGDAITITFESAFGVFAAPPSAAPIEPCKVLRPALRQVAQPGQIFQFDGTQFTALQRAPDGVIGIAYQPLAPAAQRIVVGVTELVRHQQEEGAWPPISAVVLGPKETAFFPLPSPSAYIFTQSGMSPGLVLSCNLLAPFGSILYQRSIIVMGQPLDVPLSASDPNEVHFDISSNTFVRGPYPSTFPRASTAVRGRYPHREQTACGD